jgi:Zn-dependent protease/CBS domain-containing protein
MSYGVQVRNITLHLFGGVSNLEREPPSPGAELLTAVVGPLASILLGIGFTVFASLLAAISMNDSETAWSNVARLGPVTTLLFWLGPINVMIGFFNLVPAFPLDGGRILRAAIWSVTDDLHRATRWASLVGQAIGWMFVASGIAMVFGVRVPFFGTGFVSGLWLAFIGWFLHSAAAQASARVALDEVLSGLSVEQLMQREGPTVPPDISVADLVEDHFMREEERSLPVVYDGVLLGLVSVSDVRAVPPNQWAITSVGSIMRAADVLVVAKPSDPLVSAFERLSQQDIGQLPVLQEGTLVGMLRRRDVTRWLELAWRPAPGRATPSTRPSGASHHDVHYPHGPHPRGA